MKNRFPEIGLEACVTDTRVTTSEEAVKDVCGDDTVDYIYDASPHGIDLTKYNKWTVLGWTILAVLLLADIVVSALF